VLIVAMIAMLAVVRVVAERLDVRR
jgi:hypothetical protein